MTTLSEYSVLKLQVMKSPLTTILEDLVLEKYEKVAIEYSAKEL